MTVSDAQGDLRRAYVEGGPGVFVSSVVWFSAALAEHLRDASTAFAILFFGGMLIYPVSTLVARLVFRRAKEAADNPLAMLGLECTIPMIGGLVVAWLILPLRPALAFPVAAIAVGTRYAAFRTIYGDRTFWALGGLITAIGAFGVFRPALMPVGTALAVGAVELCFAILLTSRGSRMNERAPATALS